VLVEHRVAPWLDLVDRVLVLEPGAGVVADGAPAEVLGREGARLAAHGVWVPGHLPVAGRRGAHPRGLTPSGPEVLRARKVAVAPPRVREPVLRDVDLTLTAGAATCLVGPNGVGKSTLALALAGLTAPLAGEVTASAGLTAGLRSPHPHRWRARDLVTRIGTVFQEPQHQFLATTVADELEIGPRRSGQSSRRGSGQGSDAVRSGELLERLRLGRLARANPFTLSGGEQRRLSVATVLATRPRVLVLDEPTFGQDARTWAELVDLLAELLDEGAAVLAVTHDEHLVSSLADDVLRLPC
jgi:energy-coupling factor transport system ATP-binding protein